MTKLNRILFGLFLLAGPAVLASETGSEASERMSSSSDHAEGHAEEVKEAFNPAEVIMHHIADSHGWHLFDWNDHPVSIPLPVILYTEEGLVVFSSSAFHHDQEGTHVVEAGGQRFVNIHEKIYYASDVANAHGVYAEMDEETHAVANQSPWDISITKNVASLLFGAVLILWLFLSTARSYKKNPNSSPKGLRGFVEPLVVFVRDDIAKNNIGPHYARFVPMLLTIFFFIWINNLMGPYSLLSWGSQRDGEHCRDHGSGTRHICRDERQWKQALLEPHLLDARAAGGGQAPVGDCRVHRHFYQALLLDDSFVRKHHRGTHYCPQPGFSRIHF